jgi:hypothetical protein
MSRLPLLLPLVKLRLIPRSSKAMLLLWKMPTWTMQLRKTLLQRRQYLSSWRRLVRSCQQRSRMALCIGSEQELRCAKVDQP